LLEEAGTSFDERTRIICLLAAYLHDTGRRIPHTMKLEGMHHAKRSQLFIQVELPGLKLGLSDWEIESIALLARGHDRITEQIRADADTRGLATPLSIVRDSDALDRVRFNDLDTSFLELGESHLLIEYVKAKWTAGYRVERSD